MARGKAVGMEAVGAAAFVPEGTTSLRAMRDALQACRGCDLYQGTTQGVFGEGQRKSKLILVGEQPGDREDIEGHPFVGPAGRELDRALEMAGVDRKLVFVTNVVKHFKFERRGKRRIHQKPNATEIEACKPWLIREIEIVKPGAMVLLGATAAKAFLGSSFRITKERGVLTEPEGWPPAIATWHPSAVVREREDEARYRMRQELADDLKAAAARAA